jgi:hypothetical protein
LLGSNGDKTLLVGSLYAAGFFTYFGLLADAELTPGLLDALNAMGPDQ